MATILPPKESSPMDMACRVVEAYLCSLAKRFPLFAPACLRASIEPKPAHGLEYRVSPKHEGSTLAILCWDRSLSALFKTTKTRGLAPPTFWGSPF